MRTLAQDLKHGARLLRANPGATAAAVLALALGIGGCTAIFSVVNAVLLRPLPYERPEEILHVWGSDPSRKLDFGPISRQRFEQIRQAATRNKELFLGSIRMLANAIDEKDPYTRGHSERVAFYSALIAKHMGMSSEEVERVHLSGIIHDVGKIGIEDKILRKPAALTDDEYEIMKQHPRKGEKILEAVPLLKEMAGAGLMHHENVDGSGYPDGLKGSDIPLLGRIVSVADAFDAMTTDRPYSKAMTFEASLARLRFLAGKKFDPDCVTAIEKAAAAGELTPARARRASVAARQADVAVASR